MKLSIKLLVSAGLGLLILAVSGLFTGLSTFNNIGIIKLQSGSTHHQDLSPLDRICPDYITENGGSGGVPLQYYTWHETGGGCGLSTPEIQIVPLAFVVDWVIWSGLVWLGLWLWQRGKPTKQVVHKTKPPIDPQKRAWNLAVVFVILGGILGIALAYVISLVGAEFVFGLIEYGLTVNMVVMIVVWPAIFAGLFAILWQLKKRISKYNATLAMNALWSVIIPVLLIVPITILLVLSSLGQTSGAGFASLGTALLSAGWALLVYFGWIITMLVVLIRHYIKRA